MDWLFKFSHDEHLKRRDDAHEHDDDVAGVVHALLAIDHNLTRIAEALEALPPAPGPSLGLNVTVTRRKTMSVVNPLAVKDTEDVAFTTTPKDSAGNPTAPSLTWTSSDPSVLSLTPSADSLSCKGVTLKIGVSTVTVTDGANTDSIDLTVSVGGTASLGLSATATPK